MRWCFSSGITDTLAEPRLRRGAPVGPKRTCEMREPLRHTLTHTGRLRVYAGGFGAGWWWKSVRVTGGVYATSSSVSKCLNKLRIEFDIISSTMKASSQREDMW